MHFANKVTHTHTHTHTLNLNIILALKERVLKQGSRWHSNIKLMVIYSLILTTERKQFSIHGTLQGRLHRGGGEGQLRAPVQHPSPQLQDYIAHSL